MTPRHDDRPSILQRWGALVAVAVSTITLAGLLVAAVTYYQPRSVAEAATMATTNALSVERSSRVAADQQLGERVARIEASGRWQLWYLQQLGRSQGISPPQPLPAALLPAEGEAMPGGAP
jgi:hypothetical protein